MLHTTSLLSFVSLSFSLFLPARLCMRVGAAARRGGSIGVVETSSSIFAVRIVIDCGRG